MRITRRNMPIWAWQGRTAALRLAGSTCGQRAEGLHTQPPGRRSSNRGVQWPAVVRQCAENGRLARGGCGTSSRLATVGRRRIPPASSCTAHASRRTKPRDETRTTRLHAPEQRLRQRSIPETSESAGRWIRLASEHHRRRWISQESNFRPEPGRSLCRSIDPGGKWCPRYRAPLSSQVELTSSSSNS